MSDYDVPIAIAALAEKFPRLKVAEASTHERFSQNPGGYLGRKIVGEANSFSVDFTGGEDGDGNAVFNPNNFEPMKDSLESGDTLVLAAYFDTDYQDKHWKLPKKGGNGGVYLAQITPEAIIVPVAVDIKSKKPFGMGGTGIMQIIKEMRPKVEVRVGKPIEPKNIEQVDRFKEILEKREKKEPLTDDDRADFSRIRKALQSASSEVMEQLSFMLPEEKRG